MPKSSVSNERNRPTGGCSVIKCSGRGSTETIPHRCRTNIKRRVDRKKMTANIPCDVMFTKVLFDKFGRCKNGAFGTADAKTWWTRRDICH